MKTNMKEKFRKPKKVLGVFFVLNLCSIMLAIRYIIFPNHVAEKNIYEAYFDGYIGTVIIIAILAILYSIVRFISWCFD